MKKLIQVLAFTFIAASSTQLFAADDAANANNAANNQAQTQTMATTETAGTTTGTTTSATTNNTSTTTITDTKHKPINMSTLIQQLQKAGFIVKNVEFDKDNNQFKVDVVDRFGEKQNLEIAGTGLTSDQKKTPKVVALVIIVKKFEKNGNYVKSVQVDGNTYKIAVVDKQGNQQDQTVDSQTGKTSS